MDEACRTYESDETCTKSLVGKYEAEIPLCRLKDIIKLTLKEE